ncbi:hypothetical protein COEREDRAFT_84145 [Coemansia reversa NRRL 1564]|uniref:Uncharacterized protein n=1 Tax=Coemansia reversa (strain ATCC 12441 / NRRL 1564) TaxID=763665 RepID=A0A2G5BKG9_COERN|nr:hypothetical protein COEREDRAFT_84145 [Coemansia reversa NRRL 1564]|eukprot:PIA19503.1 hypothetical protein COEREDRAFT_84145 [Coemansia reversa NRRL 1564]
MSGTDTTDMDRSGAESTETGRCESPLLPMGQRPMYRVDPDRLSQQLGHASSRQSQQSILCKNYAIPEDGADTDAAAEKDDATATAAKKGAAGGRPRYHMRRPPRMLRSKSQHVPTTSAQLSPSRDLSSRLKSACRRLNPRRFAKTTHHQRAGAGTDHVNANAPHVSPPSDGDSASGATTTRSL